jgi:hypothetical protein
LQVYHLPTDKAASKLDKSKGDEARRSFADLSSPAEIVRIALVALNGWQGIAEICLRF